MTTKYFEFVLKYTTTITIRINLRYDSDHMIELCISRGLSVPLWRIYWLWHDHMMLWFSMNIENTKISRNFKISQAIKTIHFLYNSIWRIGDVVSINDQDTCSLHNLIMITRNLARVKLKRVMKISTKVITTVLRNCCNFTCGGF